MQEEGRKTAADAAPEPVRTDGETVLQTGEETGAAGENSAERMQEKPAGTGTAKKKAAPQVILLRCLLVLVPLAVIVLVWYFYRESRTIRTEKELYGYFGEVRTEYGSGQKLRRTDDGQTLLGSGKEQRELSDAPLFNGSDDEILLPAPYLWMDQRTVKIWRLDPFSTITIEEDGTITLQDGELSAHNASGFLFNGNTTYIFLEEAVLDWGSGTRELPSLSFVTVTYGESLNIYERGTRQSTVVLLEEGDSPQARLVNGGSISLDTNKLYMANGTWMLLITRPELLERMPAE